MICLVRCGQLHRRTIADVEQRFAQRPSVSGLHFGQPGGCRTAIGTGTASRFQMRSWSRGTGAFAIT